MLEAVVFDLDGTLWDSSEQVIKAWNSVLEKHKKIKQRLTPELLKGYMGKPIDLIAELFFPELEERERMALVTECIKKENDSLAEKGGKLYDKLEQTLKKLKSQYRLFIVSNCQEGYIEAFLKHHRLEEYFEDYELYGRTRKPKGENIRLLLDRNNIKTAVYVGDTQGDLDAAEFAGTEFIFAAYGFGAVNRETLTINNFCELIEVLKEL
jgi:phosphoglycolate phosphatase